MSTSVRRAVLAMLALAMTLTIAPGSAPAANFDGTWSVLIVTQSGDCDRAYRYPVRISGGRVQYNPEPGFGGSFNISGRVTAGGAVSVTVSRGNQSATGVGRLHGNSGSGTWKGKSPSAQCSGQWTAERKR